MKYPSIQKSISFPEPLYMRIQEQVATEGLSFSAVLGKQLAKSYGLNPDDYGSKTYRKVYKHMSIGTYALARTQAADLPQARNIHEFEANKCRPYVQYLIALSGVLPSIELDEAGNETARPYTANERSLLADWGEKFGIKD